MAHAQTQRSKVAGFQFKQFSIAQCSTAMKVSTDGIMLGAWAELGSAQQILDVGTGTGLLALMCKQRAPHSDVRALDIEPDACAQARSNVAASPWPEIEITQGDAQHFDSESKFDLLISNPPYFDNALKAQDDKRNLARHTDSLPFSALIDLWQRVGHVNTELAVILPREQGQELVKLAEQAGGHLRRLCEVKSTERKEVSRWLMQFSWQAGVCEKQLLVIHAGDYYSEDYRHLCREFYLRF
ncbi:tRNA1(Val) (adenine(37)-N6)-methyltransferase [Pseudoalteromonas sp. T1lg10]|uniref:tRNA1(Val) (adenine(37)-N6)-methyltransferase n=1 Tax=Pseudoalteromonas sp. T1lg10 TaxID=2077093 RepID=UPI002D76BA60|nr:methyltransferase [Pseudoalteromonas sp. T1lg10]